jgi:hypothetical protein
MQYDIASKVVIGLAKESILRRFLEIDPKSVEIIEELPQEIVSLRRSDFPMRVTLKNGQEKIVLLEVQTEFDEDFVLRLIEYTVRFKRKYRLEVDPFVMLFTPTQQATGVYQDNVLVFKYQVFKFWEVDSKDFRDEIWLYPFLPLMRDGENLLLEAERAIYKSKDISDVNKADLLIAMAIFTGFKDKNLALQLIKRRRDIMRRSPTYDIFLEEVESEKKDQWMREGLQQGMRKFLLDTLILRFEQVSDKITETINSITDAEVLNTLHQQAVKCISLREFEEKMKITLGE